MRESSNTKHSLYSKLDVANLYSLTYVALIVAHVDVILYAYEAVELVERLGQLLGKVRRTGILEALDKSVRAARVQAASGVCGHGVDEGSMRVQRVL